MNNSFFLCLLLAQRRTGIGGQKREQLNMANADGKHPLQSEWVWWFDNPKLKKAEESWEDNLKTVNTFGTVEDFWCLFNNIIAPKVPNMQTCERLLSPNNCVVFIAPWRR
jgi:hypothetical protein